MRKSTIFIGSAITGGLTTVALSWVFNPHTRGLLTALRRDHHRNDYHSSNYRASLYNTGYRNGRKTVNAIKSILDDRALAKTRKEYEEYKEF